MSTSKLLEKKQIQKIGKKPVVILALETWQELENRLEDLVMLESGKLRKKISKARLEKKVYSATQVKKLLGI